MIIGVIKFYLVGKKVLYKLFS